jgi:hypothetical protein
MADQFPGKLFVGSTHLKVDFAPANSPYEASCWVVDASAYRGPNYGAPRPPWVIGPQMPARESVGGVSYFEVSVVREVAVVGGTAAAIALLAKVLYGAGWLTAACAGAASIPLTVLAFALLSRRSPAPYGALPMASPA